MLNGADELLLRRSVEIAQRGLFSVTANPRVGCVIAKDGQLLGSGAHLRGGDAHAEVHALRDARERVGESAIAGATAYVSLEPCCHAGRTPACTDGLIEAGISRVVVAMLDPHPKVGGQGISLLRAAGIPVDLLALPEAQQLNYGHSLRMLEQRPYVRIKIAQSLDGRTAMASGESKWITGPAARQDVQYWRARSCALITGLGTVEADNPSLTVRAQALACDINGESVLRQPLRVVLDSAGRANPRLQVFTDGGETLWEQGEGGQRTNIPGVLKKLAERGCNEVLVEAGPTLVGEMLAQDIWDEILVYTAPKLLGSDARPTASLGLTTLSEAVEAKLGALDQVGDDVRTRLVRPDRNLQWFDVQPPGVPDGFFDLDSQ